MVFWGQAGASWAKVKYELRMRAQRSGEKSIVGIGKGWGEKEAKKICGMDLWDEFDGPRDGERWWKEK